MMRIHLICIWLIILFCPLTGESYEREKTHPLINANALLQSDTDNYLIERLGFRNGIEESFDSKIVSEWIQLGGKEEDEPSIRGMFHFHDPTKSWDKAGILSIGFSSLDWAQNNTVASPPPCDDLSAFGISCPEAPPSSNPEWSWPAARTYFYQAVTSQVLTSLDATVRDQKFGKTFLTLGHVMHLLADAAVPEMRGMTIEQCGPRR